MKFRILMKDPDGVYESLDDIDLDPNNLPSDVEAIITRYFEFGEYLTVEFDTSDVELARVVPKGEPDLPDGAELPESLPLLRLTCHAVCLKPGAGAYDVELYSDGYHQCECRSFKYKTGLDRLGFCKHIRAVLYKIREEGMPWEVLETDPRLRPGD